MKPVPVVFDSIEQLLAAMDSRDVRDDVDRFRAAHRCSIEELVRYSVAGNTFRAFPLRRLGLSPSHLYRAWTAEWIREQRQHLVGSTAVTTADALQDLLVGGAHRLAAHWNTATAGRHDIGFGRAAKLLGLSLKHVLWYEHASVGDRSRLAALLDVPLDSYTLQGIHRIFPELGIPANATMRYVTTEAQYRSIQSAIRGMCRDGLSPLHYETLAWRLAHPRVRFAENA
jgi:hypothetical protein